MSVKDNYRISYAQNREDIILAAFFEGLEKGFYVDIGANDPDIESVTKYFYERGWSGINIEPQPEHFKNLKKKRKRDINLNIGVGQKADLLTLRRYRGDGLSTFSTDVQAEYLDNPDQHTRNFTDVKVPVKPLKEIFREYQVGMIQFMKVDVEGFEFEVLAGNDWERYRPQVICIEANHVKKDWHSLLLKQGYHVTFFDGLNEYFTDQRFPEIAKNFSYVKSILLAKPVAPRALAELISRQEDTINELTKEAAALEQERDQLKDEIVGLNAHALYLQNELNEIISLRAHIKKFTRKKVRSLNQKIENKLQPKREFRPVVPGRSGDDLLEAAYRTDVQNLTAYNRMFAENGKLRAYRTVKGLVGRTIHSRKAGS